MSDGAEVESKVDQTAGKLLLDAVQSINDSLSKGSMRNDQQKAVRDHKQDLKKIAEVVRSDELGQDIRTDGGQSGGVVDRTPADGREALVAFVERVDDAELVTANQVATRLDSDVRPQHIGKALGYAVRAPYAEWLPDGYRVERAEQWSDRHYWVREVRDE